MMIRLRTKFTDHCTVSMIDIIDKYKRIIWRVTISEFEFKMKIFYVTISILIYSLHTSCQAPPEGCRVIRDGACFRYYEENDGINWLDAQNDCLSRDFNLTTIRDSTDDGIVLMIIPDGQIDCWIGLNDRDNEGTYVWADGSPFAYENYDISQPDNATVTGGIVEGEDCFQTKFGGPRAWNDDYCNSTEHCYICGIMIAQFGTTTPGTTNYSPLNNNEILFSEQELFCVTESGSDEIEWTFTTNSEDTSPEALVATSWSTVQGVSTVNASREGFYRCKAQQLFMVDVFFVAGIFNTRQTTNVQSGRTYNYTVGVERESIAILCDPTSNAVSLENTRWNEGASSFPNPLNIFENRDTLFLENLVILQCIDDTNPSSVLLSTSIRIQGPPTIRITYPGIQTQVHSQIAPIMNSAVLPLPPRILTLSTNLLQGRWRLSNNTYRTEQTLVIDQITEDYNEVFKYFIINWDGEEVLAIQIQLTTIGITDDCDAIYSASCFTFISGVGQLTWLQAEQNCLTSGGHLASIESEIESNVLTSIEGVSNRECWIGLNDINVEAGTGESQFTWVDGTDSSYRNFTVGQPTNNSPDEDFVYFRTNVGDSGWANAPSARTNDCYFCKSPISIFGQSLGNSAFSILESNSIFTQSINLVCINELNLATRWTFREESLSEGTDITNVATQPATGLSQLSASISTPGYYSCEVEIRGVPTTFTTGVFNITELIVADSTVNYNYLLGVDDAEISLFCDGTLQPDVPILEIVWRRNGGEILSNPLNILNHRNDLVTNSQDPTLSCINRADGRIILTTTLFIHEPPLITVTYPGLRTMAHNQIAPRMNTIALPLPPQSLTLGTNLIQGRWRLSNNTFLAYSTLCIDQITPSYDETFRFYVLNWEIEEVLAIQISITTTGIADNCGAIYAGSCLTFTSDAGQLTWMQAEQNCLTSGGHLASIESEAESNILAGIEGASNRECWIGLNDINVEAGTDETQFTWIDGTDNLHRDFRVGQPTNNSPDEDFVYLRTNIGDSGWVNAASTRTNDCYFCKRLSSLFGRVSGGNTYSPLGNNMLFTNLVNLVCINENLTTTWTYRQGSRSTIMDLTGDATQPAIGLSQLTATISKPGLYTCEIRNKGVPIRFTTGVYDPRRIRVAESAFYEYIVGIDTEDANLFCNSSLRPNIGHQDIAWRRKQCIDLSNPLNIFQNRRELRNSQDDVLDCVNIIDDEIIFSTNLMIVGPPMVTFSNNEVSQQLLLLPPSVNQISLQVFSRNRIGVNINNGEWQSSNGRLFSQNSSVNDFEIAFARLEDTGLYSYYTERNWDNERKLIVSVNIEVDVPYIQRITSITSADLDGTAASIEWELAETPRSDSNETFYIFTIISDSQTFQSVTTNLSYVITGLTPNVQITIVIELEYAYSSIRTRNTTDITLTIPIFDVSQNILSFVIPITVLLVFFSLLICGLVTCFCYVNCRRKSQNIVLDSLTIENQFPRNIQLNRLSIKNTIDSDIDNDIVISHFVQDMGKPGQTYYNTPSSFSGNGLNGATEVTSDYQSIDDVVDPMIKPIQLDYFKTHLDKIWKKRDALETEYDSLGDKGHRYPSDNAMLVGNKKKNRFKQIYPYDRSRVILRKISDDDASDYINASNIPGYYVPHYFIASQAPKDNTLIDFWRMIVENEIVNIVMVSKFFEDGKRKCEQYFPTSGKNHLEFGPFNITLREEVNSADYSIRIMLLSDGKRNIEIKHFHFTAWPDHDVPILFNGILNFIHEVHQGLNSTKAPILVHCSAGVGRTGTFISIFNLMPTIQHGLPINIYRLVHEMREHRPQMVQTFRQYKFIYLSVLEIIFGNTAIPSNNFIDTYKLYLTSDSEGYVSTFYQQFCELNYQCDKSFEYVCSVANYPGNAKKNIESQTLPCDSNRVILHSESDYINAIDIFESRIIIGVHPIIYTLGDFYQMIYQYEPELIVMLTSPEEKKITEASEGNWCQYWPTSAGPVTSDPFQLTMTHCETSGAIDRKTITLNHLDENKMHSFQQIISPNWAESGEPTDLCAIVRILKLTIAFRQEHPLSPIIIHSSSGIKQTDIFYTAFKAIEESTLKNKIDIFQIVKHLRSQRMNSMPELNHFLACYALVNEYCCDIAV